MRIASLNRVTLLPTATVVCCGFFSRLTRTLKESDSSRLLFYPFYVLPERLGSEIGHLGVRVAGSFVPSYNFKRVHRCAEEQGRFTEALVQSPTESKRRAPIDRATRTNAHLTTISQPFSFSRCRARVSLPSRRVQCT